MTGTHSSRRINALAGAMRATRYLEVGVNKGETFRAVEVAERVAVDPEFRFDWEAEANAATVFHQVRRTHPQTLVWREPRQDFRPLFNSLETISRMSWFEMRRHYEAMRVMPEAEALALVTARLGA